MVTCLSLAFRLLPLSTRKQLEAFLAPYQNGSSSSASRDLDTLKAVIFTKLLTQSPTSYLNDLLLLVPDLAIRTSHERLKQEVAAVVSLVLQRRLQTLMPTEATPASRSIMSQQHP